MKVVIRHWKYNDGWYPIPEVLRKSYGGLEKEFREEIVGWQCWAYPEDGNAFLKWLELNMRGKYDCTFRFNNGDPMFTVWIKENEDATLFKLRWI